jgi:uncharacterized membrane protein/sporulation protein YlmC with PRC-barrel domain
MIRQIPLNAKVMCTDGLAGESTSVVVNPATKSITHLVVQDKTFPNTLEWLVPVEKAVNSTPQVIQLNCTREELSDLQPFVREHYLEHEFADYGYAYSLPHMMAPSDMPYLPVEELNIPQGDLALNRGTHVEALDGHLGQIRELLLDPKSGEITHFTLMRGHLWGKKEVIIPLSFVERTDMDTIYLNASKRTIDDLPSLPLNRPWKEVNPADLELMAWSFKGMEQAEQAFKVLKKMEKNKQIDLLNVALITKGMDGKVSLREIKEIDTQRGMIGGAIAGGLVGLLVGPGGAIIGAAGGAVAGRKSAKGVDVGVSNDKLKPFQEDMPDGSSAIVLIVEHRWYAAIRQALAGFDPEFFHQRLTDVGAQDLETPDKEESGC